MLVDLGILWEWEHDERFVKLLDSECIKANKSSYIIAPYNLSESIGKIISGALLFKTVLDRATDTNPSFRPIIPLLERTKTRIINDPAKAVRANNKATMHLEFITAGLNVPYTIMISPTDKIEGSVLSSIGTPFVIKPAEGGGGYGVVLGAGTIYEVVKARERHSDGLILIQEEIIPAEIKNKKCWFRVFFVCGKIIPCFWDVSTHYYERLTQEEETEFSELFRIAEKINQITGLEFFSTEVARTRDGRFVVVDYVNDQCDLRFQSDAPDGVPDEVIHEIVGSIIESL